MHPGQPEITGGKRHLTGCSLRSTSHFCACPAGLGAYSAVALWLLGCVSVTPFCFSQHWALPISAVCEVPFPLEAQRTQILWGLVLASGQRALLALVLGGKAEGERKLDMWEAAHCVWCFPVCDPKTQGSHGTPPGAPGVKGGGQGIPLPFQQQHRPLPGRMHWERVGWAVIY